MAKNDTFSKHFRMPRSAPEGDYDNDPYIYSDKYGCWVFRNVSSNSTDPSSKYCYYGDAIVVILSIFLVLSMVLALVGNIMVILTIARHRGMRTRTNLLLANLAIADILVAILDIPIALITVIKGNWIFPHAFCDFNGFTVGLGLMLSVHTLMWIRRQMKALRDKRLGGKALALQTSTRS
ncbi:hypothetical protein SK128_027762 [Halocaridina rubra]|uniref:G-protein coupled receptors family 1 profile domain-containing protein n=1 Tax=Halocaridina rubra TaxID=373956 RepID=A0AAN8XU52_HALRR